MRDKGGKVDDSAMAKVTVSCQGCGDFEATSYHSAWRKHLLEEGHQAKAREKVKAMAVKEKKRTVVVFGVSKVKPSDLLKYFGDLTFVTNIVFWGEREDFLIVTFLYSRFREAVLKTSHIVRNRKVYLRPLDDIPEVEWISICPFAAPDKDETVKMETDNDNPSPNDYDEETSDEGLSDIEVGATAASFRSSGYEGSREKPEEPAAIVVHETQTVAGLDIDPNPVSGQSNDAAAATPLVPKLEPGVTAAAEVEIVKSGPQNKVLDTINIDDSDDQEPDTTSTVEQDLFDLSEDFELDEPGIEDNDTQKLNPDLAPDENNNRKELMNRILEQFYNVNLLPETEWELRKYVTNKLQSMLRGLFPHCILIQYGIGSTALFNGPAALNLYADINGATGDRNPNNIHDMNNLSDVTRRQKLKEIEKHLRAQHFLHIFDTRITDQEVIFRYSDTTTTGIICRIHVSGFLAVQSCRLVQDIKYS